MASQGTVVVRVYTSDAQLPLQHAPVTFYNEQGGVITVLLTDMSGRTKPLPIATPDISRSQRPEAVGRPYTTVKLRVDQPGFQSVLLQGVQVFPGIQTIQTVQMLPLLSRPAQQPVVVEEPGQNL